MLQNSLFAVIVLGLFSSCLNFNSKRTKSESIEQNFSKREKEIMALAELFWKLKPADNELFFEPGGNRYSIFVGRPGWSIENGTSNVDGLKAKLHSSEMALFLKKMEWTISTVQTLNEMLEKANCDNISTDETFLRLDFSHSDISSDCYIIYKEPVADSTIQKDSALGIKYFNKFVRVGRSSIL